MIIILKTIMIGTNMKKVIAILTCFILAFSPFVLNFYGLIDKDLFIACISLNISLAVFAFSWWWKGHINIETSPRFDGKMPNDSFSTYNGIGFSLFGDFRYDSRTRSTAQYEFFTLGVPLIPCACWRISSERVYPTIDDGYSRKEKKDFIVYGSEKIYFLEFFSIMLLTWSGTAAVIIAFIIFIMMIS